MHLSASESRSHVISLHRLYKALQVVQCVEIDLDARGGHEWPCHRTQTTENDGGVSHLASSTTRGFIPNYGVSVSPGGPSYAAGRMPCGRASGVGRQEGTLSAQNAASPAAVRESRTGRGCGVRVATTGIRVSTQRAPSGRWVPTLPLRQRTPGRMARSAAGCVGSTSAGRTNVHKARRA